MFHQAIAGPGTRGRGAVAFELSDLADQPTGAVSYQDPFIRPVKILEYFLYRLQPATQKTRFCSFPATQCTDNMQIIDAVSSSTAQHIESATLADKSFRNAHLEIVTGAGLLPISLHSQFPFMAGAGRKTRCNANGTDRARCLR